MKKEVDINTNVLMGPNKLGHLTNVIRNTYCYNNDKKRQHDNKHFSFYTNVVRYIKIIHDNVEYYISCVVTICIFYNKLTKEYNVDVFTSSFYKNITGNIDFIYIHDRNGNLIKHKDIKKSVYTSLYVYVINQTSLFDYSDWIAELNSVVDIINNIEDGGGYYGYTCITEDNIKLYLPNECNG